MNFRSISRKAGAVLVTGAAALASGLAAAQTSTDPGLAAIQGLNSNATSYITAGFALLVITVGGFWGMAMFKKVAGRSK